MNLTSRAMVLCVVATSGSATESHEAQWHLAKTVAPRLIEEVERLRALLLELADLCDNAQDLASLHANHGDRSRLASIRAVSEGDVA
jgi:hypothetical protein